MISSKEAEFNILKFIYQVGKIRTSDLSLYLLSIYNHNSAVTRTLRRLLSLGYIEKEILTIDKTDNNKKGVDIVYTLTPKGRLKYLDTEEDERYKICRPMLSKNASTVESEKTNKLLTDIGIMAMFRACNIPVFPGEKPSLKYLKDTMQGLASSPKEGYLDHIDKELCTLGLSSGIFYTASEYMDYIKDAYPHKFDTILGTRVRGVFISNTSCFAIYTSEKYANRILKVNLKGENGFIESLETLRSFTNIYRPLPDFDELGLLENGRTYVKERAINKPYALIISDGESLAYATATGYSRGKKKNVAKATIGIENAYHENDRVRLSKQTTFLTAASNLYDKIYVVPSDTNGLYELNFLLANNLESIKQIGEEIAENDDRVFRQDLEIIGDLKYSCIVKGKRIPVTFIPVFEAKGLYKIANSNENPIIITNRHLLNMISHSIGKEGRFYDYENMHVFSINEAFIYDKNGYIKGKRILELYLNSKGLTFSSNKEPSDFPRRLGLTSEELYNKIAREEIELNGIEEHIMTRAYNKSSAKKKKPVTMSISINADLAAEIKKAAKEGNLSVSKYVSNTLKSCPK